MSVDGLSDRLSISKVAVRRHLDQLEGSSLVQHVSERCDRGRPRYMYSLSSEGESLFPDLSSDLACQLIEDLEATLGRSVIDDVLKKRTSDLIDSFEDEIEGLDLSQRVQMLVEVYKEQGYLTELGESGDGGFVVTEHHCPLIGMAQRYPTICQEELRVFREVTGAQVECHQRIANGSRCCQFKIFTIETNDKSGGES